MALLDKWDGPFAEEKVRGFLRGMREGAVVCVYRTARTKAGQDVPDFRG